MKLKDFYFIEDPRDLENDGFELRVLTEPDDGRPFTYEYGFFVATPKYLLTCMEHNGKGYVTLGGFSPLLLVERLDDKTIRRALEDLMPRIHEVGHLIDQCPQPAGVSICAGGELESNFSEGVLLAEPTRFPPSLGRPLQVGQPNGALSFAYDRDGNRTILGYPGAQSVTYTYSPGGRLTQLSDWASRTSTYTYLASGLVMGLLRRPRRLHASGWN